MSHYNEFREKQAEENKIIENMFMIRASREDELLERVDRLENTVKIQQVSKETEVLLRLEILEKLVEKLIEDKQ